MILKNNIRQRMKPMNKVKKHVSKHSKFHFSGNALLLMAWGGHLICLINDIMACITRDSGKFPGLEIVFVNTNLSPKVDIWKRLGVFT
jgi:hypothetical protein